MAISSVTITRGLPLSFLVRMTNNDVPVNLHDGSWNFEITLHKNTERGNSPWQLQTTPIGNGVLVEITPEQTLELSARESSVVFVLRASKIDGTVNLRNIIRATVVDDV